MAKSSSPVKRGNMKRSLLALAIAAAACSGPAQEARKESAPAPGSAVAAVQPPVISDEVSVDYRPQSEGQSLIEVASPVGARVDVREGQALVGRDTAPMTVRTQPDHWYAIAARLPSGAAREAKIQARSGQV